jgi:hypothetical protein
MTKKTPKPVNEPPRLKLGTLAGILAQSPAVASSFGPRLGFVVVMTAMVVRLVPYLAGIALAAKGAAHLAG